MARRSVWNSVYFISSSEGEYNWEVEVLDEDTHRVKRRYSLKADHMDEAARKVKLKLNDGEVARIDGVKYVNNY
jgi:transcription antitermination factor NusG